MLYSSAAARARWRYGVRPAFMSARNGYYEGWSRRGPIGAFFLGVASLVRWGGICDMGRETARVCGAVVGGYAFARVQEGKAGKAQQIQPPSLSPRRTRERGEAGRAAAAPPPLQDLWTAAARRPERKLEARGYGFSSETFSSSADPTLLLASLCWLTGLLLSWWRLPAARLVLWTVPLLPPLSAAWWRGRKFTRIPSLPPARDYSPSLLFVRGVLVPAAELANAHAGESSLDVFAWIRPVKRRWQRKRQQKQQQSGDARPPAPAGTTFAVVSRVGLREDLFCLTSVPVPRLYMAVVLLYSSI